jgi:hypothetical protein
MLMNPAFVIVLLACPDYRGPDNPEIIKDTRFPDRACLSADRSGNERVFALVYGRTEFKQLYFAAAWYACPGFSSVKFSVGSSLLTCLKNSQDIQDTDFWAKSPCTFPPQKVPAIAQQIRPAF